MSWWRADCRGGDMSYYIPTTKKQKTKLWKTEEFFCVVRDNKGRYAFQQDIRQPQSCELL